MSFVINETEYSLHIFFNVFGRFAIVVDRCWRFNRVISATVFGFAVSTAAAFVAAAATFACISFGMAVCGRRCRG